MPRPNAPLSAPTACLAAGILLAGLADRLGIADIPPARLSLLAAGGIALVLADCVRALLRARQRRGPGDGN